MRGDAIHFNLLLSFFFHKQAVDTHEHHSHVHARPDRSYMVKATSSISVLLGCWQQKACREDVATRQAKLKEVRGSQQA